MKRLLTIFFVSMLNFSGEAQQESLHSHIFDNHFWQNPAAAGATDYHRIRLNYRMQWVQMIGAPQTATLSYNGTLGRVGLGAKIQYDKIASFERVNAEIAYAYHIPINDKLKISAGLNLKYANLRLANSNDLGLVNVSDVAVVNGQMGASAFDAGLGVYIYTDRLFAGISAINLIQWGLNFGEANRETQGKIYRQYQAMGGYRFNLGKFTLTPSAYFRMVQAAPPQVDINIKLGLLDEKLFAGFSYRTTMDFAIFLAFRIKQQIYLAYSYDFSASSLQRYNQGTHEVTVGVDIYTNKKLVLKQENDDKEPQF
ncbi:MAG: PorP/SprF family type IX secretion system membrane protein [Saprospiraceae bacterium]|nr:PorP/SprF family type IX secretion system membrane protein [Saprospiraceae bacterium]